MDMKVASRLLCVACSVSHQHPCGDHHQGRGLGGALTCPSAHPASNKTLVNHSSDHPRRTICDRRKMWKVARSPTVVRMNAARRCISTWVSTALEGHLSSLFSTVTTAGQFRLLCQAKSKNWRSRANEEPPKNVRDKRLLFSVFSFFSHLVLQSFMLCFCPLQRPRHAASQPSSSPLPSYIGFHTTAPETLYRRCNTQTIHRTPHTTFPGFLPCFLVHHDTSPHLIQKLDYAQWHCKIIASYFRHSNNMPDEDKHGPDLGTAPMSLARK